MYVVIKAERVSNDEVEGYVFPDDDDLSEYTGGTVQLMVPSGLLQDISKQFVTLVFVTLTFTTMPLFIVMHLIGSLGYMVNFEGMKHLSVIFLCMYLLTPTYY